MISVHRSSCKVPVILARFSKNTQIWNFTKIRQLRAELFHADGWIDMTKLIVAFRNFANAPKMAYIHKKQIIVDSDTVTLLKLKAISERPKAFKTEIKGCPCTTWYVAQFLQVYWTVLVTIKILERQTIYTSGKLK
jgi:hypothetical protein